MLLGCRYLLMSLCKLRRNSVVEVFLDVKRKQSCRCSLPDEGDGIYHAEMKVE